MINQIFKNLFVSNYFETYINSKRRFPQSIVFEGLDILNQYFFAFELARILNCSQNKAAGCNCTDCNWIRENNHPAVTVVTPVDFKEDASKTVISIKQIQKIISLITESSDYHRFFIFTNAKTAPLNEIENKNLSKFINAGFSIKNEDWFPLPLNRKILQDEAANALLKSVEEAPNKVTFVFLTNSKEDIISTITSRSLIFKMPSPYIKDNIDVSYYFKDYPNQNISDGIELSRNFTENFEDTLGALNSMQEYLSQIALKNKDLRGIAISDIKKIQRAKKEIISSVSPKNSIESLFIAMSKEGRGL